MVLKLEPIAAADATDVELLGRMVVHDAQMLAGVGEAQEYILRRKIAHPDAVEAFKIGFANRTLGYRLPHTRTVVGAELRARLRSLGVVRSSGRGHFTGCLTIPMSSLT